MGSRIHQHPGRIGWYYLWGGCSCSDGPSASSRLPAFSPVVVSCCAGLESAVVGRLPGMDGATGSVGTSPARADGAIVEAGSGGAGVVAGGMCAVRPLSASLLDSSSESLSESSAPPSMASIRSSVYTHPAVSDVQVFGVPSEKYGEEVAAWVKLKEGAQTTAEEMTQFCQGQIASFKIPRYWKFVEAFPMTVTGKIQKFIMRQQSIEEWGLHAAEGVQTA